MRKVQSSPELAHWTTSPTHLISRTSLDVKARQIETLTFQRSSYGPQLPQRTLKASRSSLKSRSLPLGLMMPNIIQEISFVAKNVESEVIIESETNSVAVAANSCFAEFGKAPHEAPDLFFGAQDTLSESEKSLAVCLATPFEGNPEMLSRLEPRVLITYLNDDTKLVICDIEREHLRRLIKSRKRQNTNLKESTCIKSCWKNFTIVHSFVFFFWQNALQVLYKKV